MKRNSVVTRLYPALYRHDIFVRRRKQLGISEREVARRSGERFQTVQKVLKGKASNKKAYPVCVALGLDWSVVHNLDLPVSQFHLAVQDGTRSSAAR